MVCEGMVAVVRGLQDAGLAVTLLDGGRQYTLMPNNGSLLPEGHLSRNMAAACQMANVHVATDANNVRCDSGAQACDGRYTSVYRAAHCNVTPTSPTPMLTEFPPQKAFVCRGQGNLEVGGSGSGDKDYIPMKANGNFRGGLCWPDRGSVCTPRASHEPDAFANSLRKYPTMSPERSTEIVERLITYSQGRNSLRHQSRSVGSPTRTIDSNMSSQNIDRYSSKNTVTRSLQKNIYEPEVCLRVRRLEESPTRDRSRTRREDSAKSLYGRNFDVRHVREAQKRERARNPGFYPYTQPACPSIRERYASANTGNARNAVNMEIQAAVPMVSREVATTPRVEPIKRTVAVPLSPTASVSRNPEGGVPQTQNEDTPSINHSLNVPTSPKSVQVTSSSIEFVNFDNRKRLFDRRSKSHEDIKICADKDVVQIFENLKPNLKTDRIILKGLDKVLDKIGSINKGDKVQIKVGSVRKCSKPNTNKRIRQALNDPGSSKEVTRRHGSNIFRTEVDTTKGFLQNSTLDNIIKDWASNVHIKTRDFLSRNIDREEIVNTLVSRVKFKLYNTVKDDNVRADIVEIVKDVPFNITVDDKSVYINKIVDTLLSTINDMNIDGNIFQKDRIESTIKLKKDIQPTEEELKEFIVRELMEFLDKHDLKINFNIFDDVEMELVDILLDSIEAIRLGENIYVKEEIVSLMHDVSWFSASQSTCFADTLLLHLRDILRGSNVKEGKSQTVLVMQNTSPNSSWNQSANNTTDFSIGAISEADIEANLDVYMNQLTHEIDDWLTNLSLTCCTDKGFRQVVVNDLAADIIDRHKYIEKNPGNRGSCKDELEHLRYEIFKWINKLVGEDNTSTLEHAPELMQRIRSIPVPMLTMPDTPECCRPQGQANQSAGNLNYSGFSPGLSSSKMENVAEGNLKNKTPCQKCCGSREASSKFGQAGGTNLSRNKPTSSCSGTRVPGTCCPEDDQTSMQQQLLSINQKGNISAHSPRPVASSGICPGTANVSQMNPNSFGSGSMVQGCPGMTNSSQLPMFGPGHDGTMMEQRGLPRPNKRSSGAAGFASGGRISNNVYPGHSGTGIKPGVCTGTRQPGTCCPEDMQMAESTRPGSLIEQEGIKTPSRRMSGPGRFTSGPTCPYSSGMNAYHTEHPQGAVSGGMHRTCCNEMNMSQGKVSSVGRSGADSLPPCCQGKSPQHFEGEVNMRNQSGGYMQNAQMNSRQMPMFGPAVPGGTSGPCAPKPAKRKLTNPPEFALGTGTCPANLSQAQTHGQTGPNVDQSMYGGINGSGFGGPAPPSNCCGGFQAAQVSMFGPQGPGGSMMQPHGPVASNRRYSSPGALPTGYMNEICPREAQGQDYVPVPCCPGMQVTPTMPSVVQLNEEYDEFVKNWVKEIPIPACTPEEVAFAEKARLGIYNGIWKSLTKLKFNPATFNNRFYYEDVFDDDIEELLSLLPPNPELEAKRHLIKVNLIEKTTTTNEILKSIIAPSVYRQQLVDNVAHNLPKRATTDVRGEDPIKLHEELKILNIAEDFILFTRYKDDDKVKANIYKKKLLKKAEELVEEVKTTHGQELRDIDPGTYINDILSALHKVPVPSEDTVKEEADEILLGLEIEQWFSDLPLVENDNYQEQLNRRRLRDALAKKIHEMEKVVNLADCSADRELKMEVSKFLDKLPLQKNQDLNINFMVDELTNRMKNRPREGLSESGAVRKKSVAFEVPVEYDDFSRNMQCCSSFTELHGAYPEQNHHSIQDQYDGAFQNECCKSRRTSKSLSQGRRTDPAFNNVQMSQEWHTLSDSQSPCQVCPQQKSGLTPHGQLYQNQGQRPEGVTQQQCPSQMGQAQQFCPSQMRQDSIAQHSGRSQIGQSSLAQHRCPSQMEQSSAGQQCCPSQMGENSFAQQSGRSKIGQSSLAQHRCPSQMGQSIAGQQCCPSQVGQDSFAQQSGRSQTRQASIAQQRCPSQMGQSIAGQQFCPSQMGQGSFAQQSGRSQTRQASIAQQRCPSQMGQSSAGHQSCPSGMGQASLTQQQYPSHIEQASTVQKSCPSQMGQPNFMQQQSSSLMRPAGYQPSSQNHMGFNQQVHPGQTEQSSCQQYNQSKMGSTNFAQHPVQNQMGHDTFGQRQGCGICQHTGQPDSQYQPQLGQEMGQENISQQPIQQHNGSQFQQSQQHSQPCQNCSHGPKATASTQRMNHDETKPTASSQNMAKIRSSKDLLQSSKSSSSRHSKCFEELPQPNQKSCGKLAQSQKTKQPPSDQSSHRRPKTPTKNTRQVISPSDQNFCGPSCPSALAAKSSSSTPSQETNAPTPEYVQGFRAGQKQRRLSPGAPYGQPVGYSTPRDDARENRKSSDAGRSREDGRRMEMEDMEEEVETERDETRCRCMERMFRCRRKRPTCYPHEKFDNECPIGSPVAERKLNISGHQKEKKVRLKRYSEDKRTADPVEEIVSSTNLMNGFESNSLGRSKSQDVFDSKMQDDIFEWYEVHSNTVKVKMWGEKLQRIANKLQNSNEQERLKIKIERYLKRVPSQFSECDDERKEFRKQLPDQIIRKLKKIYVKSNKADPLNVYHVEMPNYYGKIETNKDELRCIFRNWIRSITFKRRDFLGRPIKRDDVIDFIEFKLQPFITNKCNSEQEFKHVLKSKIIEAINELPTATPGDYLNRQADKLIEDILKVTNIRFESCKSDQKYRRPTVKEIKRFVTDEIIEYLEKTTSELRASKIFRLEMELTGILVDLSDTTTIQDHFNVKSRVCEVMRSIGKFSMERADNFTDTLLKNFKETFTANTNNEPSSFSPCEGYSVYVQSRSSRLRQRNVDLSIGDARHSNYAIKGVNNYYKQLAHEVNEWLKDIQIPKQKKASKDAAVKQLAADIVDRHKYLELNPGSRGTEAEELEHLKFQIFKWINNLIGEENQTTLQRAPDLMKRIQSVPVPVLIKPQRSRHYLDQLTDGINEWYHDQPSEHTSEDETIKDQTIKSLAENIEKAARTKKNLNEAVDKEVNVWTKKVFKIQPKGSATDQLKAKLKAIILRDEGGVDKDPKQEKVYIRRYEDVIDDWIDTFPLEPKREASFASTRNEYVHELAVKLHNSRAKLASAPTDVVNKKLQEEVSDWLKKLPLHQQTNKKSFRDQFASRLIRNILECNVEESLELRENIDRKQFTDTQMSDAIIDWLKTLPLYAEKSSIEKEKHEKIMTELANRLNSAMHGRLECDIDLEIENHIKLLDFTLENDQDFVKKTALQLKLHLQNLNMLGGISLRGEDVFLEANIDRWMKSLQVNIPSDADRKDLENKQQSFVKSIKNLKANGANDDVLIAEIVNFMKTLPLNRADDFFLNGEAQKLLKSLIVEPVGKELREARTSADTIRDIISNWSLLLPLKPVHCPTELRSLINQMVSEIINLIVNVDDSSERQNDEQIKQNILTYLRKLPIKPERQDEQQLNKMATALLNDLENAQLLRNDQSTKINELLYGPYSDQVDNQNNGADLDAYLRRLIREIDEWLNTLQGHLPEIHDKCFREIVVNDLAGDIVDRHKYLEINPNTRGSDENELEHLKYQIFKWVNKLVGEDNLVTIDHASELMTRIRNISAPLPVIREHLTKTETPEMGTRDHDTNFGNLMPCCSNHDEAATTGNMQSVEAQAFGPTMENAQIMTIKAGEPRERMSQTMGSEGVPINAESTSQTLAYVSEGLDAKLTPRDIQVGPNIDKCNSAVYDTGTMIYSQETMTDREVIPPIQTNTSQVFDPAVPSEDLMGAAKTTEQNPNSRRPSVPPQSVKSRNTRELENIPEGMTVNEVHLQYDEIFKELCAQLPFEGDTPEQERMAKLARKGVHNTIWKTYFKLKSDPEVENDYVYMEFLLEETIDECLNILTNPQIENMRQAWKAKIILHVMNMLKYVHSISDTPSFREQLGSKMDRLFTKDRFGEIEYQISQGFISRIADSYILYANYKNDDPIKANIYRHRLMDRLEAFVLEQTQQHKRDFRKLDDAKMCQKAFKILESVPLPTNEVLKAEADEILLNAEIENWYRELPVLPLESEYDRQFRRRMLEVLAKKIRIMEKRPDFHESTMQRDMKHEMSVFLKRRARLKQDEDLNINFMVEELTNRLKNRKNRDLDYESFQKDVPLNSTFAHMEPVDALGPLVYVQSNVPQSRHNCGQDCQRSSQGRICSREKSKYSNQYIPEQYTIPPTIQHASLSKSSVGPSSSICTASDIFSQNAGHSGQMAGATQPNECQNGFISTPAHMQTHQNSLQTNQMPPEYIFSQSHLPQMTPYPEPLPEIYESEYSGNSSPSLVIQEPAQTSRRLPREIPSTNRFFGNAIPGFGQTSPSTAKIGERRDAEEGVHLEEEERNEVREETRCRCTEYIRRRKRRICFPYNNRPCFPSYPMPMPFPFSCFY